MFTNVCSFSHGLFSFARMAKDSFDFTVDARRYHLRKGKMTVNEYFVAIYDSVLSNAELWINWPIRVLWILRPWWIWGCFERVYVVLRGFTGLRFRRLRLTKEVAQPPEKRDGWARTEISSRKWKSKIMKTYLEAKLRKLINYLKN